MMLDEIFTSRKEMASKVVRQTLDRISAELNQRGKAGRDQVKDDTLFSPVSTAVLKAYNAGEIQLGIQLSKECYTLANDYESTIGGQIHKGAITFDLALLYLVSDDFTAAMRYFEIAETETRATQTAADPNKAESTFALFRFPLFDMNFWNQIDRQAKAHPVTTYKALWNVDFTKTAAKDDWEKLSDNSKLLFLITIAQRMRYCQLAEETTWDGANSLHLAYWNLSADLGRVVETEIKKKCQSLPNPTLGRLLRHCFTNTTNPAHLSSLFEHLSKAHKVVNSRTFDAAFPIIRKAIEYGTTWEDRIANAVYLLYATRNQVAHGVDDSMILFKDPNAATFTVDVLLSLCRVEGWTN